MNISRFFPFLEWLPKAKKTWKDDLVAGLIGTIIVIPQAVAFAMIAGLNPIYGFYTAILTPIIAALFGSSYHLVSGPTTAMSIVVYASISEIVPPSDVDAYVGLTLVLTFMAGMVQFLLGILKMGKLVNFVSHSVIIGFTAGAGILIAFKQLKHVFGIDVPQGSEFYEIIKYIFNNFESTNWYVFTVALGTLLSAIIIRSFIRPLSKFSMLIAMVLGSLLSIAFGSEIHGISTVGEIPSHLPSFSIPEITLENIKVLLPSAFILALLGLVSAVAIAKSIALHTHQSIDANQEFIGQGLSNIVSSFFSSYAGSGSFTRSGVNHQAGAKTPLSAIFASFFLVIVLLLFTKYASFLPKAAMGGIILLVGYNLVDFHHINKVVKSSYRETAVLFTTLLGTLFLDMEFALLIGILLSLFFYLERTSNIHIAKMGITEDGKLVNIERDIEFHTCPEIAIVRIDGSIYFGALERLIDFFSDLYNQETYNVLVIANGINFIDLAGAEWFSHEVEKFKKKGGRIVFIGAKLISLDVLKKGGFMDKIGHDNFYRSWDEGITDVCKDKRIKTSKLCEIRMNKSD